jgi:hypothetical protein
MAHTVRDLSWGCIDIVMDEGRVFFQQRWLYSWMVRTPLTDWSIQEKRNFHNQCDRQIWASWSNRVRFNVTGTHEFARRYAASGVSINFDIRWVLSNGHWNVTAWKLPTSERMVSNVDFPSRRITLDTNDFAARSACTSSTPQVCRTGFRTVPHEFGHAFGDADTLNPDEYNTGSPNLPDADSIMNVGRRLRERHIAGIVRELNTMLRGCTFSVRSIA